MSGNWNRKGMAIALGVMLLGATAVGAYYALQKPVTIMVDGKEIHSMVFFHGTVADVLEQENVLLGEHDVIEPALGTSIEKHMQIVITKAFEVFVKADGKIAVIKTVPVTVQEAIDAAGVNIGEADVVQTLPNERVSPQQLIEVIRVSQADVLEEAAIPYGVESVPDENLEKGLTRTIRQGVNGMSQNTIRITYHNGAEVSREQVGSVTVRAAQSKVVAQGTITQASRGGQRFDFNEARYMVATAYTYTGNNTATGVPPEVGLVAVDPRVIPLGSKIYIEGYGFATAADTGGSIKGDRLDVFLEQYQQCVQWGRRTVKVYILP